MILRLRRWWLLFRLRRVLGVSSAISGEQIVAALAYAKRAAAGEGRTDQQGIGALRYLLEVAGPVGDADEVVVRMADEEARLQTGS